MSLRVLEAASSPTARKHTRLTRDVAIWSDGRFAFSARFEGLPENRPVDNHIQKAQPQGLCFLYIIIAKEHTACG